MIVIKIIVPTNFCILTQSKLDACTKNIIYSLGDFDLTKYSINLVFMNINPYESYEAFKNCWDNYSNVDYPYSKKQYGTGLSYDISSLEFKKHNIFNSVSYVNGKHHYHKDHTYHWKLLSTCMYNNIIESTDSDFCIFVSSNYFIWKRGSLMDSIIRYQYYEKLPLYFPQNTWGISSESNEAINLNTDISNLTNESELFIRTIALRQFLCRPKCLLKFTREDVFEYILDRNSHDIEHSSGTWDMGLNLDWQGASHPKSTLVKLHHPKQTETDNPDDIYASIRFTDPTLPTSTDIIKIKSLKDKPPLSFLKWTDIPIIHLFETFMISKGWELYDIPQIDMKSIKLPLSSIDNIDETEWDYGTKYNQLHDTFGYILKLLETPKNKNILQLDIFDEINSIYDSLSDDTNNIKDELGKIGTQLHYDDMLDIIKKSIVSCTFNKMYNDETMKPSKHFI